MRFVYSVVRFVPDPARGEFVNVGAIVGSEESSEWEWRQVDNPVRARAIDDNKALESVWLFLDNVGRSMDDFERAQESLFEPKVELSEAWLKQLYTDHRNVVQLSGPAPMVASSAEEALDRVFNQMVIDPAHRRHPFQKKHSALAAVRSSYTRHAIQRGVNLRERIALTTEHHRERFDFAVTNGRALQLTHTWSFQVPDQDQLAEQVKAWGWTVGDVRESGGSVSLVDGTSYEVSKDIDIEVVYVPPAPGQDAPAIVDAMSVFAALDIRHMAVEQADLVGYRAHDLLVAAGVGRLDIKPAPQ